MAYYQDIISSGIFLSAAFILLRLITHRKPNMTAINTMHRSRRATVTPAATGATIDVGIGAAVVVVGTGAAVVIDVGTVEQGCISVFWLCVSKIFHLILLCNYYCIIARDFPIQSLKPTDAVMCLTWN